MINPNFSNQNIAFPSQGAFDRYVSDQLKCSIFSYHYNHSVAQLDAMMKVIDNNPERPWPKFQVAYFIEDQLPQGKVKQTYYRGQPVGLRSNYNCGTVQDAVWSIEHNQWSYSIYPWTGDRDNKRATEEVLLPIQQWLDSKLIGDGLIIDDEFIRSFNFDGKNRALQSNIETHYYSLMSGRASNTQATINNLRRLVREYVQLVK